jgi:hypothetical protein
MERQRPRTERQCNPSVAHGFFFPDALVFEVDGEGVSIMEGKVKAILDRPDPETPKEMRIFVGLTGVYRRFVTDYAKTAAPLLKVRMLSQSEYDRMKANPAEWKQITVAVDLLKAAMIAWPALALPEKDNHQFIVSTDASDFAIGRTLRQLQHDESGLMVDRIIAYFSRKLHDAETRYSMYDKELLGDPRRHRLLAILPQVRIPV